MARKRISPSQIKAYRECKRKWAWRYIEKAESSSNRFAQLGTDVHQVLQNWLESGQAPDIDTDAGRIAAAGIRYLPKPHPDLKVEAHITLERERASYHGYTDLAYIQDDGIPLIRDHKTTSDFKWAKSEDDLREDPQPIIYAAAAIQDSGADACDLEWGYFRTRGKAKAKLVRLRVLRDEVDELMQPIDDTAEEIYAAYKASAPALESEYNANACDYFGGCDYRDLCNLSPMDRIRSIMAKTSLVEKLKANKGKGKGKTEAKGNGVSAKPAVNAPETKKKEAGGGSMIAKLKAKKEAEQAAAKKATGKGKGGSRKATPTKPATQGKKDKGDPKEGQEEAAARSAAAEVAQRVEQEVAAAKASYTLFINCVPLDPHPYVVMRAVDVAGPARLLVERHESVPDYRMVEYGKGPGMLVAALRDHIQKNRLPSSIAIILDSNTDEGRHTMHAFEEFAGLVIRGL